MDWINLILIPAITSLIFIIILLTGFAYLTWVERKLIGRFQMRLGPNRAWKFGLGHPIADALKMIFKEETIPARADKVLFVLAPALAVAPALLMFAVVPVGPTLKLFGREVPLMIADVNIGVLWVLAIGGVGTLGIILGGWASNNKYSLLGALRTSAQMLSYELPMGVLLLSALLVYGTFNLNEMVTATLPWYLRGWLLLGFPALLHRHAGRDQPQALRFPGNRERVGGRFWNRIRQHQVRALLHDRVPARPRRQRRRRLDLLRRLARAVRRAGARAGRGLFRSQDHSDDLPVHLGQRQRPAAPLRSVVEVLLDLPLAVGVGVHGDYGGDGGVAVEAGS